MGTLKVLPQKRIAPEVMEVAHQLVNAISSGDCIGFVAAGVRKDGDIAVYLCGPDVPLVTSIGASSMLHRDLLNRVKDR